MKVICEIDKHIFKVTLPSHVVDGQGFELMINGTKLNCMILKAAAVLVLQDEHGLERHVHLRQGLVVKQPGESEVRVGGELHLGNLLHYPQAVIRSDLPGSNLRATSGPRPQVVRSQITGKILNVLVEEGQVVSAGQTLIVIEAMKMENRIMSQSSGTVSNLSVKNGDAVQTGKELLRITS